MLENNIPPTLNPTLNLQIKKTHTYEQLRLDRNIRAFGNVFATQILCALLHVLRQFQS